jgi:heptosyltransferase-2
LNVWVLRFGALGDCILLCPFLGHLKQNGVAQLTVVTKRRYAELFAATTGVDRVIGVDESAGFAGLRRVVRTHRSEDFVTIDAHGSTRSRLLCAGLGGAEVRIAKYYPQRVGLILFKRPCRVPRVVERYSKLGEKLGFPPLKTWAGGIEVPPSAARSAESLLGRVGGHFVCLAPGSRWPMKRWAPENYAELARRIAFDFGYDVVLLGDRNDAATASDIVKEAPGRVVNLIGRTGVIEAAAVIARATVFIGNDSGLTHLAEAVGVPVIALFGPTVEEFGYYPSLPQSKVLERSLPCRPCSRNGRRPCPRGTQECLTGIPVGSVEEALWDLLEKTGPARYIRG